MKLYATTTSERATKSQGGNKFLTIDFLVGSKNDQIDAGRITLKTCGDGIFWIDYFEPHTPGQAVIRIPLLHLEDGVIQKGKKQKSEHDCIKTCIICPKCDKYTCKCTCKN